jgi:hypothetical protein
VESFESEESKGLNTIGKSEVVASNADKLSLTKVEPV